MTNKTLIWAIPVGIVGFGIIMYFGNRNSNNHLNWKSYGEMSPTANQFGMNLEEKKEEEVFVGGSKKRKIKSKKMKSKKMK
jgi:hypothetical protein